MELVRKWVARVGAVVTTATLAVFVPAVAWASTSGAYDVAVEAARARRRGGFGFGLFSLVCCLVVVAVVVVAVLLVMRSRKRR